MYKRENSSVWQCSTSLGGKNRRVSTKEESLSAAKDFAEDWFLELRGHHKAGILLNERTFADAAKKFVLEYNVITEGERNAKYVQDHQSRLNNHLLPFFGKTGLSKVTAGAVQEYRAHRLSLAEGKKPPARSTLHHEIVTCLLYTSPSPRD